MDSRSGEDLGAHKSASQPVTPMTGQMTIIIPLSYLVAKISHQRMIKEKVIVKSGDIWPELLLSDVEMICL